MENPVTYLNSNDGSGMLAFGEGPSIVLGENDTIEQIQDFINDHSSHYIFVTFSYDLKQQIHGLKSTNENFTGYPLATLWIPKNVIEIQNSKTHRYLQGSGSEENQSFISAFFSHSDNDTKLDVTFKPRLSKQDYLNHVTELKTEIQYGNIYEVNFCQEFYAENVHIDDPESAYFKLNRLTKAPFSCYVAFDNFYVMSGSPERFIKRQGDTVLSQPIKGTSKRGNTTEEDDQLKYALLNNPKERSENVMIVDLVRNDLSRIAQKNSVNVDELFGIYSFETVHQMISTISCKVDNEVKFTDILNATFPMGSMTGAPKISAMKLIEKHENFRRGIYSGSVGYIAPNGDFDLNVIIRSIVYNANKQYMSCAVGGAITIQSSPESEYEECNVKVKSILEGMNG